MKHETVRTPEPKTYGTRPDFLKFEQCFHPEHKPPTLICYEAGEHQHTCPACGLVTRFIVPHITC